jgi:hypothetical protein
LNCDQTYKVKIRSTEIIRELKVDNLSSCHQIRLQNLTSVKISKIEDPNCVLGLQYNTKMFGLRWTRKSTFSQSAGVTSSLSTSYFFSFFRRIYLLLFFFNKGIYLLLGKLLYSFVLVSLTQLIWTMHKNMQSPGFKPQPPPKKSIIQLYIIITICKLINRRYVLQFPVLLQQKTKKNENKIFILVNSEIKTFFCTLVSRL